MSWQPNPGENVRWCYHVAGRRPATPVTHVISYEGLLYTCTLCAALEYSDPTFNIMLTVTHRELLYYLWEKTR